MLGERPNHAALVQSSRLHTVAGWEFVITFPPLLTVFEVISLWFW